jgi:hypothetical protein
VLSIGFCACGNDSATKPALHKCFSVGRNKNKRQFGSYKQLQRHKNRFIADFSKKLLNFAAQKFKLIFYGSLQ